MPKRDESGYIEVWQQRAGSLNIKKLLLIKGNKISIIKEFRAFLMYRKMQESVFIEVIPLICISAIWGRHPVFSHPELSGLTVGSGCSLMGAGSQVFFLSAFQTHQPILEGCNR